MGGFGESLRSEREARDKTIEEVSAATGIRLAYLEALERNDFEALPGRAFGKLYIRAYARLLGFDPRPLIEAYDRERQVRMPAPDQAEAPAAARPRPVEAAIARWRQERAAGRYRGDGRTDALEAHPDGGDGARADAVVEEPVAAREEPLAAAEPGLEPVSAGSRRLSWVESPWRIALASAAALLAAAGAYQTLFRHAVQAVEPSTGAVAIVEAARPAAPVDPPGPRAPAPSAVTGPAAVTASPRAKRVAAPRANADPPRVPEFGVGRRIVSRRIEGAEERFGPGEVAWFSTRVLGGRRGDTIRHVWLHEGRPQQTIDLALGGRDWRTYSRKTLWKTGRWAVEARDDAGRVIARSEFTCAAGPP